MRCEARVFSQPAAQPECTTDTGGAAGTAGLGRRGVFSCIGAGKLTRVNFLHEPVCLTSVLHWVLAVRKSRDWGRLAHAMNLVHCPCIKPGMT
jgi:hypothetical protein